MTDLDRLVADIRKAEAKALVGVSAVVSRGALNIKRDAARRISGHPHLPSYPSSITYDLETSRDRVEAHIGADKQRSQGPLGNILEFGTSKTPPIPHLSPALDAEEPRYIRALTNVAAEIL